MSCREGEEQKKTRKQIERKKMLVISRYWIRIVCVCVAIKFAANIEFKDVLAFRYSENENIVDIYTRIVPIPINKTS